MTSIDITIPTHDTTVLILCPVCNHQRAIYLRTLLRGTEFICESCHSQIEFAAAAHTPSTGTLKFSTALGNEAFVDVIVRQDGLWITLNEGERSMLEMLDHDSDRAVAIIIGSMIEDRLQQGIISHCKRNKKMEDRLFQPSGPMGAFSTKIDLAYMIGLISDDAHHDLIIFKDIRNLFAHNLAIKDFRSRKITDKAKQFRLIEDLVDDYQPKAREKDRMMFNFEADAKPTIYVKDASIRKKRARDRYLMTAQLITFRFAFLNRIRRRFPWI